MEVMKHGNKEEGKKRRQGDRRGDFAEVQRGCRMKVMWAEQGARLREKEEGAKCAEKANWDQ